MRYKLRMFLYIILVGDYVKMEARNALLKYKGIIGIAVAGVILAGIFVPLQRAEAFTVNVSLPNANPNSVPTSALGSQFKIEVHVSPGELISVSQIELVLDNNSPSEKQAIFDTDGHRISGSSTLTRGELELTIPSTSSGYGYGYGYVTTDTSSAANQDFISGNNVGPNHAVPGANHVIGVVGPATITIEGKLNTALLSAGAHTLDVLVHTGSGGNGKDKLAGSLTFTTTGDSSIHNEHVPGTGNVEVESDLHEHGKVKLHFSNIDQNGTISIQPMDPDKAEQLIGNLFDSHNHYFAKLHSHDGHSATTAGTVFEIDTSSLTLHAGSTIEVTIPYNPDLLPHGFNESKLKLFHWTGTGWEEITVISVDKHNHTITATLGSLSPVVAGYDDSSLSSGSGGGISVSGGGGGGGGGGSGGGGSSSISNPTLPQDYFALHPLSKMQVQNTSFKSLTGGDLFGAKPGQQVNIAATFHNYQDMPQSYAIIIQVLDQNGYTTDLSWVTGMADAGTNADGSRSWTVPAQGDYSVKIFVWDGVTTTPTPLSEITEKTFTGIAA